MEYLEFRYKLDTMFQNDEDIRAWISLLEDDFGSWIATNDFERMEFLRDWFPEATEEMLNRVILNERSLSLRYIPSSPHCWKFRMATFSSRTRMAAYSI